MDYSKEISKFMETAIEKAKELGGAGKLHALISAEEAKKQEQYYRLGKQYYKLFQDAPEKDLASYVEKLVSSDKKIAEYREELKKMKETETYRDVEEEADADENEVCEEETETSEDVTE